MKLAGGFTTNFIWCALLKIKNRSYTDYFQRQLSVLRNYLFSALAGTTWYMQFFSTAWAPRRCSDYELPSWTLHMATISLQSPCGGIILHE